MKMNFWDRLRAPTPEFFKQIRNWSVLFGVIGAAILKGAPTDMPNIVNVIATHLVSVGSVAALIAQSTVWEPTDNTQKK